MGGRPPAKEAARRSVLGGVLPTEVSQEKVEAERGLWDTVSSSLALTLKMWRGQGSFLQVGRARSRGRPEESASSRVCSQLECVVDTHVLLDPLGAFLPMCFPSKPVRLCCYLPLGYWSLLCAQTRTARRARCSDAPRLSFSMTKEGRAGRAHLPGLRSGHF